MFAAKYTYPFDHVKHFCQGKTMEFQALITKGIDKAGSLTNLGVQLGLTQPQISAIKACKKPLPDRSAAKLAIFLEVRLGDVIAAAKFAYAKTEDDRAIWRPFVEHAHAASIVTALIVTTFVTAPTESLADTGVQAGNDRGIYIMRTTVSY